MIKGLLKTQETRVWRTYIGGARIEKWHGRQGEDDHFPEDWAASTTRAVNPGREHLTEGLSRVENLEGMPYLADIVAQDPEAVFGEAHVRRFGARAGFLVKLIDAGERLTIQVHPDKRYAKDVLNSDYGKTESWYILDAQEDACIYMGFKPGITRERWKAVFEAQDIPAMVDCLHRIPVHAGDCYFIAAGVPHAIGKGCLLAEVQEPTDYTMRTELVTPGGLRIHENQCHQGVGYEKMLDCFHYDGMTQDEVLKLYRPEPQMIYRCAGGTIDSLIDERLTELFSMHRMHVSGEVTLECCDGMSILIVVSGRGSIACGEQKTAMQTGDVFVRCAGAQACVLRAEDEPLHVIACYPPKA